MSLKDRTPLDRYTLYYNETSDQYEFAVETDWEMWTPQDGGSSRYLVLGRGQTKEDAVEGAMENLEQWFHTPRPSGQKHEASEE